MKVALAQLNYTIGDFEFNKIKIINHINLAKAQGADLVVFSEQSINGAPAYDLLNRATFLELCEESLVEIASYCESISVLVGMPTLDQNNQTVSVAAYIENRSIKSYIGKKTVDSRDEQFFLSPSEGWEYVRVKGKKVAVLVGKDIAKDRDYGGADLIVNICNNRFSRNMIERRYELFRRYAYLAGRPVLYVNSVGGQTDLIYDGSSAAFNAQGEPVVLLNSFAEDFQIVDLEQALPLKVPEQHRIANVYQAIQLGLRDYFEKNDFQRVCIAVSGGIDSAVVAAMAAASLGAPNVKLLLMPSPFSSEHSVADAELLAKNLGVEYAIVPIHDLYHQYLQTLQPLFGDLPLNVTEENIQSRIRANLIMAYANKFNAIVLNTSNKSAMAVGYTTLYGDNIGSICPIGDLYKIEVYALARYINYAREIIPESILAKPPSSELKRDQRDSDNLPPYDVLDAILHRMFEEGQSREEIINAGFESHDVFTIYEMVDQSEYKRYQNCPIFRLSTCTLGKNRIMPLTNKYNYYL